MMTSCSSSATEAGGVSGSGGGSGGVSAAPVMSLSDCQSVVVSQQQTRPVVFGDLLSSMHREVTYLLTYLILFYFQGPYGFRKVLEFESHILQAWKVLESGLESPAIRPRSWKDMEMVIAGVTDFSIIS